MHYDIRPMEGRRNANYKNCGKKELEKSEAMGEGVEKAFNFEKSFWQCGSCRIRLPWKTYNFQSLSRIFEFYEAPFFVFHEFSHFSFKKSSSIPLLLSRSYCIHVHRDVGVSSVNSQRLITKKIETAALSMPFEETQVHLSSS